MIDLSCSNPASRSATFRVGIHDRPREFRLKVEGPVGRTEALEIESCWRTAQSTIGARTSVLDVRLAGKIDDAALPLLQKLIRMSDVVGPWELVARLTGQTAPQILPQSCLSLLCRVVRAVTVPVLCLCRRFRKG